MEFAQQSVDQQFVRMEIYWKMGEKFGKLEKELARLGMEVAGLRKENAELKEEMAMKIRKFERQNLELREEMGKKVGKFEQQINSLNEQNRLLAWQIKNSVESAGNEDGLETPPESEESQQQQVLEMIPENGIGNLAIKLEEEIGQNSKTMDTENCSVGDYPPMASEQNWAQQKKLTFSEPPDFGGAGSSQMNWNWEEIEANGEKMAEDLANLVGGLETKRTKNGPQKSATISNNNNGGQHSHQGAKKAKKLLIRCKWPGCCYRSKFAHKMREHAQLHTGERAAHLCAECGQSFAKVATLKTHERTHTGERPFACPECGMAFTTMGNMRRHLQIHNKM